MSMSNEQVLLKFVQGDQGKQWADARYGWEQENGIDVPVCEWDGITCDDTQTRIVEIVLSDSGLPGTIPTEVGQLAYLEKLFLNGNGDAFTGPIPSQLVNLPTLTEVNFAFNHITGTLPTFASMRLSSLNLSSNALTGSISPSFYYGSKGHGAMILLDIMANQLTGTISEAIGQMQRLETLSLTNNQFSGTLPAALGVLKNLRYVYLDHNNFQGTIPADFANPEALLKEVWLHSNMFSGTVPAAFAQMQGLDNLYVDGNKFTGTIPDDICTDKVNSDFVQSTFDETTQTNETNCVKIACPENTYSWEGLWPCDKCPAGQRTPYLGTEGSCFPSDQKDILAQFYENTDGGNWELANNWNDDSIDECEYTGVTCNSDGHITKISLPKAGLSGKLPGVIGFLEHLTYLDLSDNKLTGFMPSDLQFPPLDYFDISGNRLRGVVPPKLCVSGGINENGDNGHFRCNFVACPAGTASPIGRESITQGYKCQPCKNGANILGLKKCSYFVALSGQQSSSASGGTNSAARTAGITILVLVAVGLVIGVIVAVARNVRRKRERDVLGNISSLKVGSSWSLTNREVI